MNKTILTLGLLLGSALSAHADTCCYVAPVAITLADGSTLNGFLKMYGNEIRGVAADGREHVLGFGMAEPSTDKKLWETLEYNFSEISVNKQTVSVNFGKKRYRIKKVGYFFSPGGLVVSKDAVGGPVLKTLALKDIRRIKRTGKMSTDNTGGE